MQQFVRPDVKEEVDEVVNEPPHDEDRLSSVLQAAMNISSPPTVTAAATSSDSVGTTSRSRVGSRKRLLDILGQLRSGLEETRSEVDQISQVVQRDSRRTASSSSSSSSSDDDDPNADLQFVLHVDLEDRNEPST